MSKRHEKKSGPIVCPKCGKEILKACYVPCDIQCPQCGKHIKVTDKDLK